MSEEVKARVVEEGEQTVVYLPVCKRVAGEIVCEEKGLRVAYRSEGGRKVLEEVTVKYPKEAEPKEKEVIVVTARYTKGIVGPIEVEKRIERGGREG